MFQLTMGPGVDIAFPDVCMTPIPAPLPDIALSVTSAPAAYHILTVCMPTLNQMSRGMVSFGDELGAAGGGVVTHTVDSQTVYELGCFTIFVDGAPAQRMTSVTGQNALGMLPNAIGMCLVPSQTTVLTLG